MSGVVWAKRTSAAVSQIAGLVPVKNQVVAAQTVQIAKGGSAVGASKRQSSFPSRRLDGFVPARNKEGCMAEHRKYPPSRSVWTGTQPEVPRAQAVTRPSPKHSERSPKDGPTSARNRSASNPPGPRRVGGRGSSFERRTSVTLCALVRIGLSGSREQVNSRICSKRTKSHGRVTYLLETGVDKESVRAL